MIWSPQAWFLTSSGNRFHLELKMTIADSVNTGPLWVNFRDIRSKHTIFLFKKMPIEMFGWSLIVYYGIHRAHVMQGWVGLWGFLWWAPSAKRKDLHGVSSGWSSVWHRSNTGLSSTQYEQIPIILGVWPFWLTPLADSLLFSVNIILAGLWLNCISSVEITLFLLADILLQHRALFQC